MKKATRKKSIGPRLVAALTELRDGLRAGAPLADTFTVRTVSVAKVPAYSAQRVRAIRESANASQATFASVFGVSPKLVQSWEQGLTKPRGPAARLLEIAAEDPKGFVRKYVSTK